MAMMIIGSAFLELRSKIWRYLLATIVFFALFIPVAFLTDYVILYVSLCLIFGVPMFFVYYSIYIERYRVPKNILSLLLFLMIQSVVIYAVNYGGGFCIGYFLYPLGETVIYALAIVWGLLCMLLTIPANFALFKTFKDELSLKEAFGCFVDFYRRSFLKKIFIYVRVGLLLLVMFLLIFVAMAVLIWLCTFVPLLAIPFVLLMIALYVFIVPFIMIVPCAYFEECELY